MRVEREPVKAAAASGKFTRERDYWLKKLSGKLEKGTFPFDFKRKPRHEPGQDTVKFDFSAGLFQQLLKSGKDSDHRLHIILAAGLAALLGKYTGHSDIIVGTPIYRQDREGEFINTVLPLRNRTNPGMSFKELVMTMKETIAAAVEHQNYSIEVLLQKLGLPYLGGDFPLFAVGLVVENIQPKKYLHHIHLDLLFCFQRSAGGIAGEVEYNPALYRAGTIEQIIRRYSQLLTNALNNVNLPLAQISMLTEAEKKRLLIDFNDTGTINRFSKPIHELFGEQVMKTPGNAAIAGTVITYGELNRKAGQLAYLLKRTGVSRESVVGIMMEPSADMVVGLMGILKAGGAYLPIDTDLPGERVHYMLEDAGAAALVTTGQAVKDISFTELRGFENQRDIQVTVTPPRPHIVGFDQLPQPNRRLINLENYKNKIGMASVTNCMSLQATRGCPYHCLYCHKIWSKHHIYRRAENIYSEIEHYYTKGVTNFAFIDDCFNLNIEKSRRVFDLIIKNNLKVQIFFPNGLRGDMMTPGYIDLMVEAGTRGINLSLETASPRLQNVLKKNLDLDKFKQVMDYIACRHPNVILEMASMHGFPTETEEEAVMTLDFIKGIHWLHFPYIHILKIFPNTEMETFALEHGVSKKDILASRNRAFHQLPETLPFPKSFTRKYQAEFLNNYFLNKERLLHVLPHQMKVLSETALVQKYNAYLPVEIKKTRDLIEFARLDGFQVPENDINRQEKDGGQTIFDLGPEIPPAQPGAQKILLLDLSQHFSSHRMLYRVVEQPLGLISLLTHLKKRFGGKIDGRIYKSGIDFDNFRELKALVTGFSPGLVGIRTLTFFKEFFHETVSLLRQWGIDVPVITGGPYASSDYDTILKDKHVNLAVLGEGEDTLGELIAEMFKNDFKLPGPGILGRIRGIAYRTDTRPGDLGVKQAREIILVDQLQDTPMQEGGGSAPCSNKNHLAYVMYTSGSTGKPKGVMVEHRQVNNCISWMQDKFNLEPGDVMVSRTNLTFDPSVWEIFWPLYIGAGIKILDVYQRRDAEFLIRLMAEETTLTMMYCPATLIGIMTHLLTKKTEKPTLKLPWLIIGAEPIAMEVVKDFYTYYEGRIVNTYGPTECTVNNTYYDLDRHDGRAIVPIGKPVANNKIYILDRNLQPVPWKTAGEICIAGAGTARGYINDWQKTGRAFVKNPFGKGRLFKTGDMGRWLEDGTIEIMGRTDEQVKIRGHRIELGEIRSVLSRHPAVSECIVLVKDTIESKKAVKTCNTCGITSQYPNININSNGICNICELYSRNKAAIDNYFTPPPPVETNHSRSQSKQRRQIPLFASLCRGKGGGLCLIPTGGYGL